MERFFQILADGVHRFEGTVNQYTGDGIMALFGAPIAHEDHAARACYAALHSRTSCAATRTSSASSRGSTSRFAWDSTRARSWWERSATICGWTTRRSVTPRAWRRGWSRSPSRGRSISRSTPPSSSRVLRASGSRAARRSRGQAQPLGVYELEGMGSAPHPLEVSRARGFSKFVGRRARHGGTRRRRSSGRSAGSAQVVGIVADPGVGKSRLCFEFVERLPGAGDPGRYGRTACRTESRSPFSRCSRPCATTSGSRRTTARRPCATRSPGGRCASTKSWMILFRCSTTFSASQTPSIPLRQCSPRRSSGGSSHS